MDIITPEVVEALIIVLPLILSLLVTVRAGRSSNGKRKSGSSPHHDVVLAQALAKQGEQYERLLEYLDNKLDMSSREIRQVRLELNYCREQLLTHKLKED